MPFHLQTLARSEHFCVILRDWSGKPGAFCFVDFPTGARDENHCSDFSRTESICLGCCLNLALSRYLEDWFQLHHANAIPVLGSLSSPPIFGGEMLWLIPRSQKSLQIHQLSVVFGRPKCCRLGGTPHELTIRNDFGIEYQFHRLHGSP
jgi:hypothetical protein